MAWLTPWSIFDRLLNKYILKQEDGLGPSWEFPNVQGQVLVSAHASTPYMRFVDFFYTIFDKSASYVRSNQSLSTAIPISFTITNQPDVPRNLTWSFDSHANITAFTLVFTGKDAQGKTITETFTEANGWSGATSNAYAKITSIVMTSRTGTGSGDTMDIGIGSYLGLSNNIYNIGDVYKITKCDSSMGTSVNYDNYTVDTEYSKVDVSSNETIPIASGNSFTIYYRSNVNKMS